jgi:hypothetical protein
MVSKGGPQYQNATMCRRTQKEKSKRPNSMWKSCAAARPKYHNAPQHAKRKIKKT